MVEHGRSWGDPKREEKEEILNIWPCDHFFEVVSQEKIIFIVK